MEANAYWQSMVKKAEASIGDEDRDFPEDVTIIWVNDEMNSLRAENQQLKETQRCGFCIFCGKIIYRRDSDPEKMTDEQVDEYIRLNRKHCMEECTENPLRSRLTAAEGLICRISEKVNEAQLREEDEYVGDIAEILETAAPCPHAAELEKAKGENERLRDQGCTDSQVFFYEREFYVLSNFSAFSLQWRGRRFDTSEAAYHSEKFPKRGDIQKRILCAPSAHEALKIANHESVIQYRRQDWEAVKVDIMRNILRAKADQHEYVRRKLLETGDRELIENSWRDGFWGWAPNGKGKNMLGRLWMEIRTELRKRSEGGKG